MLPKTRSWIKPTIVIVWLIAAGTSVTHAQPPELPPAYYPPGAQRPTGTSHQPAIRPPNASAKTTPVPARRQILPIQKNAPAPIRPRENANPIQLLHSNVDVSPSTNGGTSTVVPRQDDTNSASPIGVAPALIRRDPLVPLTSKTTSTTSQIQRRRIDRLPITQTAVMMGADTNSDPTNGAMSQIELAGPVKNPSDVLPPPEFQSPAEVYRIADADAGQTTHSLPAVEKPPESAPTGPQAIRQNTPTPSPSSQPTAAGGHGGLNAGWGGTRNGAGCGPGCGGCAQCASPFSPDPNYDNIPFNPNWEWDAYSGKWWNCVQKPWISWGRGLYGPGPTPPSKDWFGRKNPINPAFLLYGDYRTALAYNDNGANDKAVWAHRLNLDFDFKWTATERLHAFWGPLDKGNFTRFEADNDELKFQDEFDEDFDTLFFEGDLGYIWGGFTDQYAPFDLPVALGRFPLFFQNGIWFNEVIEGFAFTIPARHFRVPTVSNWELTWFFGFDDVANPAFANDDDVANIYGMHGFWELQEGYLETGYAFLDDQTGAGLGFHSFGFSWSRRYFHRVSNAIRLMLSSGQAPNSGGRDTADGQLLLIENAWISNNPNYFVPYFNLFAGFGAPQSAARAADNILVNTGINFETDALTGYPTLDASGKDAWGGALGVNLLGPDFSWQWIVEFAWLQTFGDAANRQAVADQYAVGTRYQIPLNYAWILRMDAMHGFLEEDEDVTGARVELRWKF